MLNVQCVKYTVKLSEHFLLHLKLLGFNILIDKLFIKNYQGNAHFRTIREQKFIFSQNMDAKLR